MTDSLNALILMKVFRNCVDVILIIVARVINLKTLGMLINFFLKTVPVNGCSIPKKLLKRQTEQAQALFAAITFRCN